MSPQHTHKQRLHTSLTGFEDCRRLFQCISFKVRQAYSLGISRRHCQNGNYNSETIRSFGQSGHHTNTTGTQYIASAPWTMDISCLAMLARDFIHEPLLRRINIQFGPERYTYSRLHINGPGCNRVIFGKILKTRTRPLYIHSYVFMFVQK